MAPTWTGMWSRPLTPFRSPHLAFASAWMDPVGDQAPSSPHMPILSTSVDNFQQPRDDENDDGSHVGGSKGPEGAPATASPLPSNGKYSSPWSHLHLLKKRTTEQNPRSLLRKTLAPTSPLPPCIQHLHSLLIDSARHCLN